MVCTRAIPISIWSLLYSRFPLWRTWYVSSFLSLLLSLLILFYFLFVQGPVGDLKCLSCIAHSAEECHPRPRLPIRPSTTVRSRLLGTIDGSLSCVECDKAHASHCSHTKLADVSLFYAESLQAPSFASTQHEPSSSSVPFIFLILESFFSF